MKHGMTFWQNRCKKWAERLMYLLGYLIAMAIAILFFVLRAVGRVRMIHPERIPCRRGKTLVVSNHPSFWEPILLVAMFGDQFFLRSIKYIPWSAPDKGNFSGWWWRWARPRFITVPRGSFRGQQRAVIKAAQVLRIGGNLIVFPEGGRTSSVSGPECHIRSRTGKIMRRLKNGVGDIIRKSNGRSGRSDEVLILPVWVEGADRVIPNTDPQLPRWLPRMFFYPLVSWFPRLWHRVTIHVGEPFSIDRAHERDRKEITLIVQEALLKTADEAA